jgi:3-phenylpropionate/trans-cinnamate dioxygenase ferredoxin reductase component
MHYRYLLIGGGIAADSAARGIRQVDTTGSIGLISKETDPPYNRPPLSKGLWGRMPLKRIWRNTATLEVDVRVNETALSLDPRSKRITTNRGSEITYDRLLLATGGEPVQLTPPSNRIIYFRTLQDYHHLRALTETSRRFLVIGGGFIGSELSAVLAQQGKEVTMIFPEVGIGGRVFPAGQAHFLNEYFRSKGVTVLARQSILHLEEVDEQVKIVTDQNETMWFDGAVAGLGIRPNIELAAGAGLAIRQGIVVDPYLRSEHEDIFVAGDVMEFCQPVFGKFIRVEHEEHANASGLLAGRGMAGELEPYTLLPSFYSDLFDLTYQAVGDIDARHSIVMDWEDPHRKGIIYYLSKDKLCGIALWNRPYQDLETARSLIISQERHAPHELIGKI